MATLSCRLLVAVGLLAGYITAKKSYSGYKIIEVTPHTDAQLEYLFSLEQNAEVDVMEEIARNRTVMVITSPLEYRGVFMQMMRHGMTPRDKIKNVQSRLDRESSLFSSRASLNLDLHGFNEFDTILATLKDWAHERCPSWLQCEARSLGDSYEGRPLMMFSIGQDVVTNRVGNPGIIVESTIHAREWLATATVLAILDKMLDESEHNSEITYMLKNYNWFFLPVANPDGYVYTWSEDRLWRKNRTPNDFAEDCPGTDLNRNFPIKWGGEGISFSPCSNVFCGPGPASEPETQAIMKGVEELHNKLEGGVLSWLSVHAYGHMFMFPWGHHREDTPWECFHDRTHDDMMAVATEVADAMEATSDDEHYWLRGTTCDAIYATSGGTSDWGKSIGIKYPFAIEVHGDFFDVQPSEIESSASELWTGLVTMIGAIERVEGNNIEP